MCQEKKEEEDFPAVRIVFRGLHDKDQSLIAATSNSISNISTRRKTNRNEKKNNGMAILCNAQVILHTRRPRYGYKREI